MKEFTVGEILKATGGELIRGREEAKVCGFSIDSREISPEMMFFPILGSRNDGHDFLEQVYEKGCRTVAVSDISKASEKDDINVIAVKDTTKALQDLSKYYFRSLPLKKVIGVTGSVGKTSTRDLMYYVAATKYKTARNKKNYNSAHGLPLTILEFDEDIEIAVLEMGMDAIGDISLLADIVRPDIAIITKIAEVNIEMMGNLDNILDAKMEITDYFDQDSTLIVNSSCPMLTPEMVQGEYHLITAGEDGNEDYVVEDVRDFGDKGIKFTLNHNHNKYKMELPTAGAHNALNAALAVAAGELIGISPEEAALGLKNASLTGKRLKIEENNGVKVIDDTYNACEDSVKSALNTLMATEGQRHVAILGDIIGLAGRAEAGHKAVGRHAAELGVDLLVSIGDDAKYYQSGAAEACGDGGRVMTEENNVFFGTKDEFIAVQNQFIREGDVILVKASRGMEMEKIVNSVLG